MPLAASAYRLLAQVLDLGGRDPDVPQEFAGEDDGRPDVVLVDHGLLERDLGLGCGLLPPRREAQDGVDGLDAAGYLHLLGVRGQGDGDPIEEVIAQLALVGVERRDQEGTAGVGEGYALALHDDLSLGNDVQQYVGGLLVQEVDVVDVQDAAMGLGEQARAEHRPAVLDALLEVGRSYEAVLHDVQGHLHERRGYDLRLPLCERHAAAVQLRLKEVVDPELALRVDVELTPPENLDGG